MTNQDIKRARWWIQRWKAVGGGFAVAPGPRGIEISLARQPQEDERTEAIYAKTAGVMEAELRDAPKKSETVFHLVAEMIAGASVPLKGDEPAANDETPANAANDQEEPDPAA